MTAPPPPPPPASTQVTCTVQRVLDGDTFECGDIERVRFIGIDAPEMGQHPFGAQSKAELSRLMPTGTDVRLQRDITLTDVYGRRLAYVWQGTVLMNELLVARGYAIESRYPPDTLMIERLRAAERAAAATNAGLWATDGFACEPGDWRRGEC